MGENVSGTAERQIARLGFHHVAVVTRDLDGALLPGAPRCMHVGEVVDRTARGAVSRHCQNTLFFGGAGVAFAKHTQQGPQGTGCTTYQGNSTNSTVISSHRGGPNSSSTQTR